jgi:alpha-1,2-mannosyltransferase
MTQTPAMPRLAEEGQLHSRLAWMVWMAFAIVLTTVAGGKMVQSKNSVVPAYREASVAWMHSQPIYELQSIHGFLYLPASAVLTAPLAWLPTPAHELAFRALSVALLAWSLYRLATVLSTYFGRDVFLILTLCVIPPCVGPARAGQMNILLAATMTFAIANVITQRWWSAALWLGLGLALKPQAIVLAALLIALCPAMRVRGAIAVAAAIALPFLFQSPGYVVEQYQLCFQKLSASGRPSDFGVHNNDISGLFGVLSIQLSEDLRWILRAAAAALTLLACGLAIHRKSTPLNFVLTLALAASYLVLFNPRSEGGSYVVVAVPVAVCIAWKLSQRRWPTASLLTALIVGWALSYPVSQWLWTFASQIGFATASTFREGFAPYWFSPTLAIVFVVFIIKTLFWNPELSSPSPSGGGLAPSETLH